jgi:Zn-dependent protease/CBS domain-containing protein
VRASFPVGRIFGVPVRVNWSVLIIFALIAYLLAGIRFPAAVPFQPTWAYIVAGVGAALVFFGGLLAHEVSHAVVAKRNGIGVSAITLWLFGGVAALQGEAKSPGAELRIAGVGPLVSFLIAVCFAAVYVGLRFTAHFGLIVPVFFWLALINAALVVFNIVPAAPLDGGRLLRSVLWKIRGDRNWAARVSSRVGQVFGILLIAFGLWELFRPGFGFGGLWLAIVGWFLFSAASLEHRQAAAPEGGLVPGLARAIRVRQVMSQNPTVAPAELTVNLFIDNYLMSQPFSAFPLIDDAGRPGGLVTANRVKSVPPEERADTRLADIACPPEEVPTADPEAPLSALLPRMDGCADGRALVWHGGYLVGIVTPSDIRRAMRPPA